MVELAWYVGVVGNSLLSFLYFVCGIYVIKRKRVERNSRAPWGGLCLITFAFMITSIILLYLQQNDVRINMDESSTYFPALMWVGNIVFITFLLIFNVERYTQEKTRIIGRIVILILLGFGMINGLTGLSNYVVLWQNGEILVIFLNKPQENLNSIILFIGSAICFYLTSSTFLEKKQLPDLWLSLACMSNLLTYFVPRTEPWSITNSVNVKLLAYIFFIVFLVFFVFAFSFPENIQKSLKKQLTKRKYELKLEYYRRTLNTFHVSKSLFVRSFIINSTFLIGLLIVFRLFAGIYPVYTYAVDAIRDRQAIYFGMIRENKIYIHLIGGFFPMFLAFIILLKKLVQENRRSTIKIVSYLFFSETLFSFVLNGFFNLGNYSEDSYSPFIAGFIVPPIILSLFFFSKNKKTVSSDIRTVLNNFTFPDLVISVTIISVFLTDMLLITSPTGKVLIGGKGIFDGIIILPLLTALLTMWIFQFMVLLLDQIFLQSQEIIPAVHNEKKHRSSS